VAAALSSANANGALLMDPAATAAATTLLIHVIFEVIQS
jgi:hypothetical protein